MGNQILLAGVILNQPDRHSTHLTSLPILPKNDSYALALGLHLLKNLYSQTVRHRQGHRNTIDKGFVTNMRIARRQADRNVT